MSFQGGILPVLPSVSSSMLRGHSMHVTAGKSCMYDISKGICTLYYTILNLHVQLIIIARISLATYLNFAPNPRPNQKSNLGPGHPASSPGRFLSQRDGNRHGYRAESEKRKRQVLEEGTYLEFLQLKTQVCGWIELKSLNKTAGRPKKKKKSHFALSLKGAPTHLPAPKPHPLVFSAFHGRQFF